MLERPQAEAEKVVEASAWRPAFKTLLLSRSEEKRKKALAELLPIYEEASETLLDEVASFGEKASAGAWWGKLRLRPFLGYASACASLHRTMVNHVLPEQAGSAVRLQKRMENGTERVRYVLRDDASEGDANSSAVAEAPPSDTMFKARALAVLLRQLTFNTAWELEESADKAAGADGAGSFAQWLERTPKLETPEYEVVLKDPKGLFEVRKYAPYSVVQTGGSMGNATGGNKAFFKLAGYIFGKTNVQQEKMAMTTPVQIERRTGEMSFIMPSKYWGAEALEGAPLPAADADVRLEPRSGETVAVSVFGGYAKGKAVEARTEALLAALSGRDDLEVTDPSNTRLMQYNDPFTVPWKRRNEVSVPVEMK